VQLLDRALGTLVALHLDEREAARTSGHLIPHDIHGVDRTNRLEHFLQPRLIRAERQIAHKQFATHVHSCPSRALQLTKQYTPAVGPARSTIART
jgi:hypothetical protein